MKYASETDSHSLFGIPNKTYASLKRLGGREMAARDPFKQRQ